MASNNSTTVETTTAKPTATAKAVARHARKVAKKADRQSKPADKGTKVKVKKSAKGEAKKVRALPTNTVKKEFERTVKGVPVSVTPVQGRGGNRVTIFGFNVCAILRWYGRNGHGAAKAHALLNSLGLSDIVGSNTVGCQVYGHETRGEPAELTREQGKKLLGLSE